MGRFWPLLLLCNICSFIQTSFSPVHLKLFRLAYLLGEARCAS